jgi:CRP-like cAMP-binding protein
LPPVAFFKHYSAKNKKVIQVLLKQTAIGNNQILDFLPQLNRSQFIDECEVVSLNLGEIIVNPGNIIHHVYFPIEGIISWEKEISDSPYLVITLIGNEGVVFPSVLLEVDIAPCRAVVQKAGFALRITVTDFVQQVNRNPKLHLLLKRYSFITYSQLLQTAACNLFHVLENRLAKLLLAFQDRSQSDELHLTQELLAQMLGVRRVGVTKAAGSLQRQHLIGYSRGNVIIYDQKNLKSASCLCYQADKDTYAQFLNAEVLNSDELPDELELNI